MSAPYDFNRYHCMILRHHDADTSWVTVDLGFDCAIKISIRWDGIDAPELSTPEGKAALAYVSGILPPATHCTLTTLKDKKEKFGRYLGTFWVRPDDETSVNQLLIDEGYAWPYAGGAR